MAARGYLGKISAIVSVNASSVAPTLNSTAREINAWAKRTQSSISSATTSVNKSFNGMFTSLQRVQRALADSRQLDIRVKGQENLLALREVAESLAKPLGDSARQLEKLGQSVELAFRPSLEAVQTAVESVRDRISRGVSVSQRELQSLLADVRQVSVAINAASEARSLAGNLTRGDTLRFADPRQFDALNRASSIQRRVESLPAVTTAGFGIGRQQAEVRRQIDLLEQLRVKQDAARLAGGDTSQADAAVIRQTARVEAAVAAYDRLTEAAEKYNAASKQPAAAPTGLDFGLALDDPQRQIEAIRGSIVSLGTQLDRLPASVRTQFIPALQAARNRLQALADDPRATAREIENAANEVDRLGQQLRRVSQVQALPNFAQSLDDSAIRGSIGSLNALQQILSRVGATAGSNAAVQFDRMRDAIQRATAAGTIGSQAFQNELRGIARDAAAAAAETGRIGQARAFREIQRGGDIARGGFDRLSLASQQAAFAIDDFFSVQGDFSQRIRAVQNNVTQLAFILGGTRGLFIGLGVAIAAQATVALIKWVNGGRTAEDQTKALNDALARQKSLVEELAQAFESLGDSIANRAFSRSAQEARDFQKQLEAIDRQQREVREARLIDNDADVGVERANQNRIRRELEGETNVGRRIVLQRQLDESQQIERRLTDRRLSQPAADGPAVRQAIQDLAAGFAAASSNRRTAAGLFGTFAQDTLSAAGAATAALPANLRNQLAGADFGNTTAAIESQIRALDAAIGFLTPIAEERTFLGTNTFGGGQAQEAIQSFTNIINALRNVRLDKELDDAARRIFEVGNLSARRIEEAQNSVAEAIEAGVPGARAVERRLNALGNQLEQAFDDLKEARAAGPDERPTLQANAQARIDRIRRQQAAEIAAADSLRRENTLNPERQIGSVISRIESEISSIGSPAAGIQGRLRELQFERESIRQQRAGIGNNPFAARRLDAAEQALTLAIRSLEDEVNVLSESFNSFNREVDNRLNPQGDAVRGLDSFETPGERAARELQQGLANIAAAADALEERILSGIAPGGVPLRGATDEERGRFAEIERRQQQAEQQLIAEQQRAAAPAIFGLADSVQNAVLQGPSRAALNVSDISTQEGARELNRLLRGEDSNRDNQNLVELQRQSTILEEMLRDVRTGVNNVAAAR